MTISELSLLRAPAMVELLPGQAPEVRLADVRAIVVTRSGKLLLAVDRD